MKFEVFVFYALSAAAMVLAAVSAVLGVAGGWEFALHGITGACFIMMLAFWVWIDSKTNL